jgi:hypothetical protein
VFLLGTFSIHVFVKTTCGSSNSSSSSNIGRGSVDFVGSGSSVVGDDSSSSGDGGSSSRRHNALTNPNCEDTKIYMCLTIE